MLSKGQLRSHHFATRLENIYKHCVMRQAQTRSYRWILEFVETPMMSHRNRQTHMESVARCACGFAWGLVCLHVPLAYLSNLT